MRQKIRAAKQARIDDFLLFVFFNGNRTIQSRRSISTFVDEFGHVDAGRVLDECQGLGQAFVGLA